ncbi:MAG: hypothetical protein Q4D51_02045 [Eubacteriales bacterium]|nr:hypothetical protein [Eubacteriales bacterium]
MNTLLLLLLVVFEIALVVVSVRKKVDRNGWRFGRLVVNAGEILIYLIMLLAPGIDMSFRFKGLFVLLVIRFVLAAIIYAIHHKKEAKKKHIVTMLVSVMVSVLMVVTSMIPSYVFCAYDGLPTTGEYAVATVNAILTDESRVEAFENDGSKREVPVYFFYPENAKENETYPLVVFSHGAFGYYQSNTSTYMELASHGYVVVSVEHPYHSLFTKDTDGKTIIVNQQFMQETQYVNSENVTEEEIFDCTSKWLELRLEDVNFVMDSIEYAADQHTLNDAWFVENDNKDVILGVLNQIDCDKIAMMGHSLGGATAVSIGRMRDDIDAVVDFDGTMLGEVVAVENGKDIIKDAPYDVPLLSFDNQEHHDSRLEVAKQGENYVNNVILEQATNGYSTYIANTGHMNYTDLPMFSPVLAAMLGTGTVDERECVETMNAITLQFLDSFLKGEGDFSVQECYELSEHGN